jgi:hypothetical protein
MPGGVQRTVTQKRGRLGQPFAGRFGRPGSPRPFILQKSGRGGSIGRLRPYRRNGAFFGPGLRKRPIALRYRAWMKNRWLKRIPLTKRFRLVLVLQRHTMVHIIRYPHSVLCEHLRRVHCPIQAIHTPKTWRRFAEAVTGSLRRE